jgi:hypothetical protein
MRKNSKRITEIAHMMFFRSVLGASLKPDYTTKDKKQNANCKHSLDCNIGVMAACRIVGGS